MAEQKRLARHVTVAGKTYGPNDDVPSDVMEKITNPKAWVPVDQAAGEANYSNKDAGTASGHRLATAVTVGGRTYGTNDFVPDDVAAQITNPKAWMGGKVPSAVAKAAEENRAAAPAQTPAPEALPTVPVADTRAGRGARRG